MPLSGFPKDQTNPDPINVDQEPLDFRRRSFSLRLSLLMPTFSFGTAPPMVAHQLQCCSNAPLPILPKQYLRASVHSLMPDYFPCRASRPVSCYALFKWIAASKQTSWLL